MGRLRRQLTWVAGGWLCCQLSLLTAAPLSLFATAPQAADSMSCTCVHGANAQCPMHHPARPKPGCQCRNTTDPDAAAIVSLLGPIAVLADAPAHATTLPITRLPNHSISRFSSFVFPPDGPPPRTA
jgi:hypothetical protein